MLNMQQKKADEAAQAASNASILIEKKRLQLASAAAGKAAAKAAGGGGVKRKQGASGVALNDNSNSAQGGSQLERGEVSPVQQRVSLQCMHLLCCRRHSNCHSNIHLQVLVGRRLVRLVRGLTKGKIVHYDSGSDTYNILFKDNERLDLTLDQMFHGGIVQLSQKKRPNFQKPVGAPQMSQRF